MADRDKGYIITPTHVVRSKELDVYEFRLFSVLLTFRGGEKIFPSHDTLAEYTGMSRRKIIETQKRLIKKGYIKVKKDPSRRSNQYSITEKGVHHSNTTVHESNSSVQDMHISCAPDAQKDVHESNTRYYKKNNISISTKEKEIKKKKKVAGGNGLPDWLDKEWWFNWVDFRKEINKTLKPSTIKLQLQFLEKHKPEHVKILQQSIQNGWTGLFEIKDHKNFNNNNNKNNDINEKHPVPYYKPERIPTEKEIKENRDFARKEIDKVMRMLGEKPKPKHY